MGTDVALFPHHGDASRNGCLLKSIWGDFGGIDAELDPGRPARCVRRPGQNGRAFVVLGVARRGWSPRRFLRTCSPMESRNGDRTETPAGSALGSSAPRGGEPVSDGRRVCGQRTRRRLREAARALILERASTAPPCAQSPSARASGPARSTATSKRRRSSCSGSFPIYRTKRGCASGAEMIAAGPRENESNASSTTSTRCWRASRISR